MNALRQIIYILSLSIAALLAGCSGEQAAIPWRVMLHQGGDYVVVMSKTKNGTRIDLIDWEGRLVSKSVMPVNIVSASLGADYRNIVASAWDDRGASLFRLRLVEGLGYQIDRQLIQNKSPIRFPIEYGEGYLYLQDLSEKARLGSWKFIANRGGTPIDVNPEVVRFATYPTTLNGRAFYLNPKVDGSFSVFPVDGKEMHQMDALLRDQKFDLIRCSPAGEERCLARRTVFDNRGATQFIYQFDRNRMCQIGSDWKGVMDLEMSLDGKRLAILLQDTPRRIVLAELDVRSCAIAIKSI